MKLKNKVAIVTGGGSGIGRAASILFAAEGAKVVIADVSEEGGTGTVKMIRVAGGEAMFIRTDVADTAQVKAMVDRAIASYGRLDIAYNNAGVGGPLGSAAEIDEAEWDAAMAINLRGVYICCKYEIPRMIEVGGGSIINQSSIGAIIGGGPPLLGPVGAYSASKAGVVGLTQSIAYTYGHQGIRANAILPGVIETPMATYLNNPASRQLVIDSTPLHRLGQPEDIAKVALFLASSDSSFVSGASIVVDGAYVLSQGVTTPKFALS